MIKKTVFVLLLVAIFTACQSGQEFEKRSSNAEEQGGVEKRIGEIKSLGSAYNTANANYILKQQNGSTLLLSLDVAQFDLAKYAGKQIEVSGVIHSSTDGSKVMKVQSVDVIDIEMKLDDVTPILTDYNGKMTAISFKYLSSYQLQDSAGEISLSLARKEESVLSEDPPQLPETMEEKAVEEDSAQIIITKITSSEDQTLEEFLNLGADKVDAAALKAYSKSKIGKNAEDSLKKEEQNGNLVVYYIKKGALVFKVSLLINDSSIYSEAQKDFYNLLATMVFNVEEMAEELHGEYDVNYADNPLKEEVTDEQMLDAPEASAVDSAEKPVQSFEKIKEPNSNRESEVSVPGATI